jgi:hypothetical protein
MNAETETEYRLECIRPPCRAYGKFRDDGEAYRAALDILRRNTHVPYLAVSKVTWKSWAIVKIAERPRRRRRRVLPVLKMRDAA